MCCTYLNAGVSFTYTNASELNFARHFHQSQKLNDGRVIVFGGYDGFLGNPTIYKSCEIYNPASNSWTLGASMNKARYSHMSVLLNNGHVMAIGGVTDDDYYATTEIYDPINNKWEFGPTMKNLHYEGAAVKLKDGRVLVAGGTVETAGSVDIYDPISNEWKEGNPMVKNHGASLTLNLLPSGKVIAIGGKDASSDIEIFDPASGKWSELDLKTNIYRYHHSSVVLPNGEVLVAGGAGTGANYSSVLNIETSELVMFNSMEESNAGSPMVILDNGNAMIFGLGSIIDYERKSFQEFNLTTKKWTSSSNSEIGQLGYTIHRLNNGKFLIIGGNFTTGNGATKRTILVTQGGFETCSEPILSLATTATENCYGKDQTITISNSQPGLNYSIWNSNFSISESHVGTGSSLVFNITKELYTSGENQLSVNVSKSGCPRMTLNTPVNFNSELTLKDAPFVYIKSGDSIHCQAETVVMEILNPTNTVSWISGELGNSISTNEFGTFAARYTNGGCLSPVSNQVVIRTITAEDVKVGSADTSVCGGIPILLKGFPEGGFWSGLHVSNDTILPPSGGRQIAEYNYCGIKKEKKFHPGYRNSVRYNLDDIKMSPDESVTICGGHKRNFSVKNVNEDEQYIVLFNDSVVYSSFGGVYYSLSPSATTDSAGIIKFLVVSDNSSNVCPLDTQVRVFNAPALKKPRTDIEVILPDTFCSYQDALVTLVNPEPNVVYDWIKDDSVSTGTDPLIFKYPVGRYNNPLELTVRNHSSSLNCYIKHEVANPKIYGTNLEVDFEAPKSVYVGDSVEILNASNGDSYEWCVDGAKNNSENLPVQFFNSVGPKTISLKGGFGEACADSVKKDVFVINEPTNIEASSCYWDTLKMPNEDLRYEKIHVDSKGNKYVYGSVYVSSNGASYSGSYAWVLAKFNRDWELQWVERKDTGPEATSSDFYSALINSIDTDDDENIYLTGSFAAKELNIQGHVIKNYSTIYNAPFIAKMLPDGTFDWFYYYHNEEPGSDYRSERGGTDIKYKDGKVYVSMTGIQELVNWDGDSLGNPKRNSGFGYAGILELTSEGEYINDHILANTYYNLITTYNPSGESIMLRRLNYTSPNIEFIEGNKLAVSGYTKSFTRMFGSSLQDPNSIKVFNGKYSCFTAILNLNTNEWDNLVGYYGGSLINRNSIGVTTDKKETIYYCSKVGYGQYSPAVKFSDGSEVDVARFNHKDYGTFISALNIDGTHLWKKEIIDFEASNIHYDKTSNTIILSGNYKNSLILGTDGIKGDGSYNTAIIVLDQNGEIVASEKITSSQNEQCQHAYLNDCGDYLLIGEPWFNYVESPSKINFRGDSLAVDARYNYVLDLPINSLGCNEICGVSTREEVSGRIHGIDAYPNPTNHIINLSVDESQVKDIGVYNILGEKVLNVLNNKNMINVNGLPTGIYQIRVNFKNNQSSFVKVLKR